MIANRDRKSAAKIAREDRQAAASREVLSLKLDVAIRLAENLARGGSSDKAESERLGAEALALITVLGEEYLPTQWHKRVGDAERLESTLGKAATEQWVKDKIEAAIAVQKLSKKLEQLGSD